MQLIPVKDGIIVIHDIWDFACPEECFHFGREPGQGFFFDP